MGLGLDLSAFGDTGSAGSWVDFSDIGSMDLGMDPIQMDPVTLDKQIIDPKTEDFSLGGTMKGLGGSLLESVGDIGVGDIVKYGLAYKMYKDQEDDREYAKDLTRWKANNETADRDQNWKRNRSIESQLTGDKSYSEQPSPYRSFNG